MLLVFIATHPGNVVRFCSLTAAWIIGTITFHYTKYNAKAGRKTVLFSVVLLIALSICFWLSYTPSGPRDVGVLIPSRILLSVREGIVPQLEIGDSGVMFTEGAARPGQGYDLNQLKPFLTGTGLTIERTKPWRIMGIQLSNGHLVVSVRIRDEKGAMVAEIIRNEWKTATSPTTWDRNYDDSSLEVRDPSGDVVLQVTVLIDRIKFQGKWYRENGERAYVLQSNGVRRPRDNYALFSFDTPETRKGSDPELVIRPMFRYPSSLHLGELAEGIPN